MLAAIPPDARRLGIALFFAIAATNILTPLLPNVQGEFGISIATAGLVVSTYGFARLLTDLPSGVILDRIGERRLAFAGVVLLAAGSAVGALAPSVEWLILARVTSGLGSGLITTVTLTALSWTAGPANRGQVMSVFQLANNTGIATYPLLGGLIGSVLSWRVTFVVAAVGAIVAGAILVPLLGRIEGGQKRDAVSGRTEARAFELSTGRRRLAIGSVYATVMCNMINRHGFRNTLLPLFAASVLLLGPFEIAAGIAVMAIVGILVVTPGARLGDRIGRRRIVVVGLIVLAIGDLTFLGAGSWWTYLLAAAIVGSGDFFGSSQTALLSELVAPRQRAQVLAGYRFFVDIGALVGPLLLASLMEVFGPSAAIVVCAAIVASGGLIAWLGVPAEVATAEAAAVEPAGGPA
ncbi:MAG TPA: MFS transporter [Candidatus Limnocylindrales bacterium]|nr:MFS transporter [Candidatus Limnocylindrales bacterium]